MHIGEFNYSVHLAGTSDKSLDVFSSGFTSGNQKKVQPAILESEFSSVCPLGCSWKGIGGTKHVRFFCQLSNRLVHRTPLFSLVRYQLFK